VALIRFRPAPLAPLLLTVLIAGCGTGGTGGAPANGSAGADKAGAESLLAGGLKPGLYEVVQTGDVEITEKECLSAEQLAKGQLAPEESLQKGWRFVRNSMSGGRFDVEATGPSNARMVAAGTYGQTSYQGEWSMTFDQNGEKQAINFTAKAKRIADSCEDKEG